MFRMSNQCAQVAALRRVLTVVPGMLVVVCGQLLSADGPRLTLENPAARLVFDTTRGSLDSLEDLTLSWNHRDQEPANELWLVRFADGRVVKPSDAASVTCESSRASRTVKICWSGFAIPNAQNMVVTATVDLDVAQPESRWRMAISGSGALALQAVHFPRIGNVASQGPEVLAVPYWMGEQTRRARQLLNGSDGSARRLEWSYPGILSLQCLALCQELGPGLLLSTDDTGAQRKQFAVYGDGGDGLGMEVVHVPARAEPNDTWETPYSVRVRLFRGDWYDAAAHYRQWAQHQVWVEQSRARRGEVPQWVLDTGLWIWNRGRSPGVLDPARALQQAAGVPVSVFWHWWHGCPYDAGFPEYLPPREGTESFRSAVAAAQEQGLHAIVYMNQRLWGMTTRSWHERGAEQFAVKNPDGTVTPEVYNTFMKVPCASMCMGTEFWRNTYAQLAAEAVCDLGVAGIYMDQACSSLACYDTSHGHPLGGGDWWMNGFHALEADIRRRCQEVKPVALAGEGCGEAWLPHLDIMLSLQVSMERYAVPGAWEPIPMFHAVYHDCAVLFGNYSSLTRPPYDDLWPAEFAPESPLALLDEKFARQFRLEQARAFVWGQQPTIANFLPDHLQSRSAEMNFVLRIARLRHATRKYLAEGRMLRPPRIAAAEMTIPMSRLSIYAGQHDAVREYMHAVPTVLAAAWLATDGNVAVALANLADTPISIQFALSQPEYPLPDRGAIRQVLDGAIVTVGEFEAGRALLDVTLEPADVRVYEFVVQ